MHQSIDVSGIDPDTSGPFAAMPGVTIRLDDGSQTVTDSTGAYSFANVAAGSRTVSVVLPEGFIGTTA